MNGAEATHGRPGGKLIVRTHPHESQPALVLAVTDNGEGIPDENLPKIFDPFFTTKPEGKGVGLGLAVAYGIVIAHGGEVAVTSRLGEGTTFTVTLPLKSAEGAEVMIGAGAPAAEKV
jgi:two-component system NtrC family sensor kinase